MKKRVMILAGILAASVSAFLFAGVHADDSAEIEEGSSSWTEEQNMDEEAEESAINTKKAVLPGLRVAVVSKNTKGEYWSEIERGMLQAVDDINAAYDLKRDDKVTMTFEGPTDEADVETQVNILDAVIAENPSVICISASDVDSCQAQLEAANDNGIPVVIFDSKVNDMTLVSSFIETDNIEVGTMAAEHMAEALGESGKVVVFSAKDTSSTVIDRVQGFSDRLSEYEDMEIISVIYENQVDDMNEAIIEFLQENPDVDGVFCTNYSVAETYLAIEKGEDPPIMIGTDATEAQQEAVKSGEEYGIVSQNPYKIGYNSIMTAIDLTKLPGSVEIEEQQLIPAMWISDMNIETEEAAEYLY